MIRIADIQRATARHYGLSIDVMSEPDCRGARIRPKARARQTAMYVSACLTAQGYKDIGRRFQRDHSTVIHAVRATRARLRTDEEQREAVRRIVGEVL